MSCVVIVTPARVLTLFHFSHVVHSSRYELIVHFSSHALTDKIPRLAGCVPPPGTASPQNGANIYAVPSDLTPETLYASPSVQSTIPREAEGGDDRRRSVYVVSISICVLVLRSLIISV